MKIKNNKRIIDTEMLVSTLQEHANDDVIPLRVWRLIDNNTWFYLWKLNNRKKSIMDIKFEFKISTGEFHALEKKYKNTYDKPSREWFFGKKVITNDFYQYVKEAMKGKTND